MQKTAKRKECDNNKRETLQQTPFQCHLLLPCVEFFPQLPAECVSCTFLGTRRSAGFRWRWMYRLDT